MKTEKKEAELLSTDEQEIVELLSAAWDKFVKLHVIHMDDQHDFRLAIHTAQNIVLSRPAARELFVKTRMQKKVV